MKLIIGNKRYSSWSLRPWLGLKVAGIPFEEELHDIYDPGAAADRARWSPTGKVPLPADGELLVWYTLAIAEYVAERFPDRGLWPAGRAARAIARSACAEMHSGFVALRSAHPMDMKKRVQAEASPAVLADLARLEALWADCRARFGTSGPFLFGGFCWADAFFAPVASRCLSYGLPLSADSQAYVTTLAGLPAFREWEAAGQAETWLAPY